MRETERSIRGVEDPRKNVTEAQGGEEEECQEAIDHVTKRSKKMNTETRPLDLGYRSKEAIEKSICRVLGIETKFQGANWW